MFQWLFPCLPSGQGLEEMIIPKMKISTPMGERALIFPTLRCAPVRETGRCLFSWPVLFFWGREGGRLATIHVQGIQVTSGSVDLRSPVRIFLVEAEDVPISEKQRQRRSTNCWISRFSVLLFSYFHSSIFIAVFALRKRKDPKFFTHHLLYMK